MTIGLDEQSSTRGMPSDYGDWVAEYAALRESAGALDLSDRGRLCLTGADRVRFLHGQVTNDVKRLRPGEGCYAALVTTKGRMQADLRIHCLPDELLLDFEPNLSEAIKGRLEKYVVADDVQIIDVAPLYGLAGIQGPRALQVMQAVWPSAAFPATPLSSVKVEDPELGELYAVNVSRTASGGFDIFLPTPTFREGLQRLVASARAVGGAHCGWQALEAARIEAGIPRFGADMDETCFPQECGIEDQAVSYAKGCYIGQEVLNRIHAIGHVNRALAGMVLSALPARGTKLFCAGKEVGHVTSAAYSPSLGKHIGLGILRREFAGAGTELMVGPEGCEGRAVVCEPK